MTYNISSLQLSLIIALALWELIWKGAALWRAARRNQPPWFVALLVINSVGILPIIYLLMTQHQQDDLDDSYLTTPIKTGAHHENSIS